MARRSPDPLSHAPAREPDPLSPAPGRDVGRPAPGGDGRPTRLTTVGFDADDTLWHNERFFALTQDRFAEILADYAPRDDLDARLLEASGATFTATATASRASCCR